MFRVLESYVRWIQVDPAGFAVYMLYFVVVVLLSLILHECAHGWVALQCGDPTAKMLGRLSLDPRRHLDPIGTVCMFLLGFGWARPVPVNPRNFRNYRKDDFLVSIAGITVNMTLFVICSGLSVLVTRLMLGSATFSLNARDIYERMDVYTGICDMIAYGGASLPDYLTAHLALPWLQYVLRFLVMMQHINLSLAIFNLLPVPPLDGYRLLDNLMRGRLRVSKQALQVVQFVFLMLILNGWISQGLSVVTDALDSAVTRMFLMI